LLVIRKFKACHKSYPYNKCLVFTN
jgi:hypothetical protein